MRFPPDQTVTALIEVLIDRTRSGVVTWSPMSGDGYGCLFDTGGIYVASVDRDERPPWEFGFLNTNGDVVDQFVAKFEQDIFNDTAADTIALLGDLFEVARASALNTDTIVDSLLTLLNSESPDTIPSHQLPLIEPTSWPERSRDIGPAGATKYAFDEEPF